MKVTILGCGTSAGVPRLGNHWGACDPTNPKNRRRRVSILVENAGSVVLVDTSPDFRQQALDAGITRLDGVLYTHDHADHCHGIDDLRGIALLMGRRVDVFAAPETLSTLRQRFDYIFNSKNLYPAICEGHAITGPFSVGGLDIVPFEQQHGPGRSLGFRFGPVAYSTDLDGLSDTAFEVLDGVKVWVVDALRYAPHPTHAHLARTLEWIARVKPERAVLTHMTWDLDYEHLAGELPTGVEPGYDGLVIEIEER